MGLRALMLKTYLGILTELSVTLCQKHSVVCVCACACARMRGSVCDLEL